MTANRSSHQRVLVMIPLTYKRRAMRMVEMTMRQTLRRNETSPRSDDTITGSLMCFF